MLDRSRKAGLGTRRTKKDDPSCLRWTAPAARRNNSTEVRHRMSLSPITIGPNAPLADAIRLFVKHNIRELPVIERGKLIGIVTDRDIRQVSPSYPLFRDEQEIRDHLQSMRVSCAMSPDPLVVSPATALVETANLMIQYRIGSMPVVEAGKLVGIISVTDLLRLFVEQHGGSTGNSHGRRDIQGRSGKA